MVKIILLLLLMNVSFIYGYVKCDVGIACGDDFICCKNSIGYYKCCPNYRYCCKDGQCCDYFKKTAFLENLEESHLGEEPLRLEMNLTIANISQSITEDLCLHDKLIIQTKIQNTYSIYTNTTIYDDKIEFYKELTFSLSEVFYYAYKILNDCNSDNIFLHEIFQNYKDLLSVLEVNYKLSDLIGNEFLKWFSEVLMKIKESTNFEKYKKLE
jgi:hypothetical protein